MGSEYILQGEGGAFLAVRTGGNPKMVKESSQATRFSSTTEAARVLTSFLSGMQKWEPEQIRWSIMRVVPREGYDLEEV